MRSLGELHAKVDMLLAEKYNDHQRIATLEKWMWGLGGGLALCMTVFFSKLKALMGF
jgi:hypothetical protein